jgi:cytosine/adenosine deaminase-related metal-dependent hydrolase
MILAVKTLLSAAYIATMAGPLLRDGGIVFDEHGIIALGSPGELRRHQPDGIVDLGNVLIVPGLINAHTHLELTAVGQLPSPPSFVDWILALRERMSAITDFERWLPDSVKGGIAKSLRFGVTAVGDITLNPAMVRPLLAAGKMRGVSYGEVLGMAGRAAQMESRLEAALNSSIPSQWFAAGIEPHAPYSLDLVGYRRCIEAARERSMPLATHLAETPDEAEFLADHSGPFRRLWAELGAWNENVSQFSGGPIRAMDSLGLLKLPALLAHVNYIDDDELAILAKGRASVVYCPRTHAYFGHPPHRFEEMLRRGINVALGTDSCASSVDLNLLEDLRLVYRARPHLSMELLWSLVTTRAATALGMPEKIGRLSPGLSADLCVFEIRTADPLREILENDALPEQVWRGGGRYYP